MNRTSYTLRAPRRLAAAAIPALAAALAVLPGCHFDITRMRAGNPVDVEGFESLEVGSATLQQSLDRLGAPDRAEWKSGKDYLWYLHEDSTRIGIRFQLPFDFFGYRHNIAELDTTGKDTNSISLVFDQAGVLEQKSLRISDAYLRLRDEEETGWSVYLIPEYSFSPILFGDGGEENYGDLFRYGQGGSLHLGILPAPFFMFLIGGNYQEYQGDSFPKKINGLKSQVFLDDLHIIQAEIGGRLHFPPQFFVLFWNFDAVKELFYSTDSRHHQGPFFYLKWTIAASYNEEVKIEDIRINTVNISLEPRGTYFDRSLQLGTTLGGGFEYRIGRFGFQTEILYQNIGAFESGNSRQLFGKTKIDTSGGDFQNILFNIGLSYQF